MNRPTYEILRSSLERKVDKTNFISPKSTLLKSPSLLGLNALCFKAKQLGIVIRHGIRPNFLEKHLLL